MAKNIQRTNIRLENYDYSENGAYHVTICTKSKLDSLCTITPPEDELSLPVINLTKYGSIVEKMIRTFSSRYQHIRIAVYCIMPNHIHLLIVFDGYDADARISLNDFVSRFKAAASREAGVSLWQSRFYDHIIRNDEDYNHTAKYIIENPIKWKSDKYYNGP